MHYGNSIFFLTPSHIQICHWICAGDEHIIIFVLIIPWNSDPHNSLWFCLCKGRNDLYTRVEWKVHRLTKIYMYLDAQICRQNDKQVYLNPTASQQSLGQHINFQADHFMSTDFSRKNILYALCWSQSQNRDVFLLSSKGFSTNCLDNIETYIASKIEPNKVLFQSSYDKDGMSAMEVLCTYKQ